MAQPNLKPEEFPWLEERTILLAETGSRAYGTSLDTSDVDIKGICIPPIEYYLGLTAFNEYDTTGGKNFKNKGKDDVDVSVFHINKFVSDALKGSMVNIELLYIEPSKYLKLTDLGRWLMAYRHLFLSKFLKKKLAGQALSHMNAVKDSFKNRTGRQELVNAYGYDTKELMNALKSLTQGIEIMKTGSFTTFRPNHQFLLECRTGRYTYEQAVSIFEDLDRELVDAHKHSNLPEEVNRLRINDLLVAINKEVLLKG
jgi:predicted nucleotidyltransferase